MRSGRLTRRSLAAVALCTLAISSAAAHIVTLEPDAYAAGTDISNAWAHEGITMRSVIRLPTALSPVYSAAQSNQPAVTGSRMFAHDVTGTSWGAIHNIQRCYTDPTWPCSDPPRPEQYAALHISFERPVDFIEAFGAWSIDPIGMILLGADGRQIERVYSSTQTYTDGVWFYGSTQSMRQSRDVYGVILGGVIGSSSVDMVRVNVPEPGTVALFSLGLLGVMLSPRLRPGR